MFSVIFPGQGSQIVGMGKEFYDNFEFVKKLFSYANEILNKDLSNIILNGPKEELELTENTQPAIFLVSYSIFKIIEMESKFKIKDAKYFAGHSLGEYSALCCSKVINFEQTLRLLKARGKAMQDAVPNREGGMLAILGVDIEIVKNLINLNIENYQCYIANDNTVGQVVVSGKNESLNNFGNELRKQKIKFVKLPVSAPFHCPLMNKATRQMEDKISNEKFIDPAVKIVSNVTAKPTNNSNEIKKLLIDQIEKPVLWRESIINMIELGTKKFIEIGPGTILSGLIKRINRNVKLNQVNTLNEMINLSND
tara:strand:+ start:3764 stop:4693 length:930 start_codon:yes stop_codon:yes gene_type:complete